MNFTKEFQADPQSTPLIEKAKDLLVSMNLAELRENGYFRDIQSYAYVFQYPPSVSLKPLNEKQLIDSVHTHNHENSKTKSLGLYLHIPYCTGTCSYCYFTRYSNNSSPFELKEYLGLLQDEIVISKNLLHLDNSIVTSIALGGGTPTFMDGDETRRIMSYIFSNFNCEHDLEVSFEASPETITYDRSYILDVLLSLGVNRLSIGIQSFNDERLRLLNRRHNSDLAINAITSAHSAGFHNVNIDLMYGLPGQTLIEWEQTLFKATDVTPQSISLYRLRIHPNGPLANITQKEFLEENLFTLMYMMAAVHFTTSGYIQISSHVFVQKIENIQKHVTEKQGINEHELLGLGVSSYSYINKYFFWNKFSLQEYKEKILAGNLPANIGILLSEEEEKRKAMVLGLQEYKGVNREKYKEKFNEYPEKLFGETLGKLLGLQMIVIDNDSIYLTPRGFLFADEICTEFYSQEVNNAILATGVHRYGMNYIGKDYKNNKSNI